MSLLEFDSFEIIIRDYVELDKLIAIDLMFPTKMHFERFLGFYQAHRDPDKSFDYQVDSKKYHGCFGLLIYDLTFKARLFLNTEPCEPIAQRPNIFKTNIKRMLKSHEERINLLVDILHKSDLVSDADKALLTTEFLVVTPRDIDLECEVEDLDKYLQLSKDTIEDIRNED